MAEGPSVSPHEIYGIKVKESNSFWILEDKSLVIRERDKNLNLTRKAFTITPYTFSSQDEVMHHEVVLKCSCEEGKSESKIITQSLPLFQTKDALSDFVKKRREKVCFHVKTVSLPLFTLTDSQSYYQFVNDTRDLEFPCHEGPIAFLSETPRVIAVNDEISWSALVPFGKHSGLVCTAAVCAPLKNKCSHIERYQERCGEENIEPVMFGACNDNPINTVRSSYPIPFPPNRELQEKNFNLANGFESYPTEIRPEKELMDGCCPCEEKYRWEAEKRVGTAKILTTSALITKTRTKEGTQDISVYVGITNRCRCKLSPDAQRHGLLNVDNVNFISHATLLLFLAIVVHGTPSFNLFSNMLYNVYWWSTGTQDISIMRMYEIVRPGT